MFTRFPKKFSLTVFIVLALLVSVTLIAVNPSRHSAHAAEIPGSPRDPNIHYVGRWDTSSSTVATSYWGGTYLKTGFTGNSVQIKLGVMVDIYASIDSGDDVFYHNVSGTVNLTPTPLANGAHTLRVATRAETDELKFQGLILDASATTFALPIPPNLIEFVGDSITAGAKDARWALSDYAWLAGEQLHAEHTQIAFSGICLTDNISCYTPNSLGMSKQFFKLQTVSYPKSPDWDFSRYQANAVVINLGTNDNAFNVDDATFQNSYTSFLQNVRAKYPNAQIFVLRTFAGMKVAPTLNAVNAVNAAGGTIHFIDTSNWLSSADFVDGIHPNDGGQAKVASRLAPILSPYLSQNGGVTTIDDSMQGFGDNQFNYSQSSWYHCTGVSQCGDAAGVLYNDSNSWSDTAYSFMTFTFTGTNISFYGVQDPSHGIGAIYIDEFRETYIDFYAPTHVGNVLLWKSPTLSAGKHTFEVQVTGDKSVRSLHTTVALDKVTFHS